MFGKLVGAVVVTLVLCGRWLEAWKVILELTPGGRGAPLVLLLLLLRCRCSSWLPGLVGRLAAAMVDHLAPAAGRHQHTNPEILAARLRPAVHSVGQSEVLVPMQRLTEPPSNCRLRLASKGA